VSVDVIRLGSCASVMGCRCQRMRAAEAVVGDVKGRKFFDWEVRVLKYVVSNSFTRNSGVGFCPVSKNTRVRVGCVSLFRIWSGVSRFSA